jgi:hypothetical protein
MSAKPQMQLYAKRSYAKKQVIRIRYKYGQAVEDLECGHTFIRPITQPRAKSRRCTQCEPVSEIEAVWTPEEDRLP